MNCIVEHGQISGRRIWCHLKRNHSSLCYMVPWVVLGASSIRRCPERGSSWSYKTWTLQSFNCPSVPARCRKEGSTEPIVKHWCISKLGKKWGENTFRLTSSPKASLHWRLKESLLWIEEKFVFKKFYGSVHCVNKIKIKWRFKNKNVMLITENQNV